MPKTHQGQAKPHRSYMIPKAVDQKNPRVRKIWADPGVLWNKAPRAMRAMRGKTLETVPFQPYFGCTKSFLKVLSN